MTPKPAIDTNVVVFRGHFTVLNAAHVGITPETDTFS